VSVTTCTSGLSVTSVQVQKDSPLDVGSACGEHKIRNFVLPRIELSETKLSLRANVEVGAGSSDWWLAVAPNSP